jgi:hypothetical protein
MTIHYFSALAGAGKTRALAQAAHRLARDGEKVLFVQPSKLLIDNTIRDEITPLKQTWPSNQQDYLVRPIHGDTQDTVVAEIVRHVSAQRPGGEILFITHQAFMRIPFFPHRQRWILIFDETPSVDVFEELSIPDTHRLLTDSIEMIPGGAAWGQLVKRDEGVTELPPTHSLDAIARNANGDDVLKVISGLAKRIQSPYWHVHILQSNYSNLITPPRRNATRGSRKLITYSLLQPSIFQHFKRVILASALFEDSMLYRLWTAQGVDLQPVGAEFREALRYQHHDNGSLITINYVSDADWSKTQRDRLMQVGDSASKARVRDALPSIIADSVGDEPFAWMGNKDLPDDFFGSAQALRLPNSPHGLNSFQHLHNVVVISALNPPPAHFRFMQAQGVNGEDLRRAHYQAAVYQAVMRISVRNPADMTPKTITVMDKSTALWLQGLFPCAAINALGAQMSIIAPGKPGRKRIHDSSANRVRASRDRKRALKATLKKLAGKNGGVEGRSYGSVFASIYSKQSALPLDAAGDDAFVKLLKDMHQRVIPGKAENFLISPATFNANVTGVGTKRGLDNIEYLRGIWLDNDGGDLNHGEFTRMFPSLRIVVWNTYSSTPNMPRWRCFIPTSEIVTPAIYLSLIEQIVQVLRDEGYVSDTEIARGQAQHGRTWRHHGFDVGKFCPSSLFYAPCQAEERSGSFFCDYQGRARKPLDVREWIESDYHSVKHDLVESVAINDNQRDIGENDSCPARSRPFPDAQVMTAITDWRGTAVGNGHRAFFKLALALKRAGLSLDEIASQLSSGTKYARSPRERRADIPNILKALGRDERSRIAS